LGQPEFGEKSRAQGPALTEAFRIGPLVIMESDGENFDCLMIGSENKKGAIFPVNSEAVNSVLSWF
jgi:hypothetical protein